MAANATQDLAHHFEDMGQQHEAATLGMWVFLATELMVFGGLFAGYTVYRVAYPDAFERAESDKSARVLLLQGSETCFTAGNDLQDFMNAPPRDDSSPTIRCLKLLPKLRKPLVAAVAGPAVGIGTTMLLHCDLVYADPNARFQLPFVNLGLCPEAASSFLLSQIVGYPRAAGLLLLSGTSAKFG